MRFFALAAVPLALAAPLLETRQEDTLEGKYFVKLRTGADQSLIDSVLSQIRDLGAGSIIGEMQDIGDFHGFALENPNGSGNLLEGLTGRGGLLGSLPIVGDLLSSVTSLLDGILDIDGIEYIEPQVRVTTSAVVTQSPAPWGLGRISHRQRGTTDYDYDDSAGQGITAYILDTGILTSHVDFGGRASQPVNFIGGPNSDCQGHGTHVAGTVGGTIFGVAKNAQLVGVKVLDCNGDGTTSSIVNGIRWAARDAQGKRAVANLSLGGPRQRALNDAAAAAVRTGLFLAVAAGNENQPVERVSPASEPTVCTVGATDFFDRRASFTNYGSGVDVLAPGVQVQSPWIGSNRNTRTISGTSMATPHVAGIAAYLMVLEGNRSPAAMCQRIIDLSTRNAISSLRQGTPNFLSYNGASG